MNMQISNQSNYEIDKNSKLFYFVRVLRNISCGLHSVRVFVVVSD
jgi:hypothetical protein